VGQLAYAKFKHNGEYIDHATDRTEASRTFIIQNAFSSTDAIGATDLPPLYAAHPEIAEIAARRYFVRPIDKGNGQYEVDVVYNNDSGTIPPPDVLYIRMEVGTTMQEIETDLSGRPIGTDQIWNQELDEGNGDFEADEDFTGWATEIVIPTLEFEVVMPSAYVIDLGLIRKMCTRCNDHDFNVGGYSFPIACVQYMGAILEPQGTSPVTYRAVHRFRYGQMDLPETPPAYYWNAVQNQYVSIWNEEGDKYIPLAYTMWTCWEREVPMGDGVAAQVKRKRRPFALFASQVYKLGDLNELITVP